MIKVLLDTNILHEEGLNSTRIQRIQRLINSGQLQLIIPEIVICEFKSKRIELANKDLEKIQSGLESLSRKHVVGKDSVLISQAVQMIKFSIESIEKTVDEWVENNNVVIYKISNTSIEDLFRSYFKGTGAFRERKKREDIPDAVIFDGIFNISRDTNLFVVLKDSVLIKAIDTIDNVESFSSLKELLELPQLKEQLEKLDREESKVNSILNALNEFDFKYEIINYIEESDLLEIESFYLNDSILLPFDFEDIDISNKEVRIKELGEIYLSSPSYLGNKKFSLNIEVESKAELTFSCEEEDYEVLPFMYRKALTKISREYGSEVSVSGIVDITLEGVLTLENIDESIDVNELKLHLTYLGADRCEIACVIEIEYLRLKDVC